MCLNKLEAQSDFCVNETLRIDDEKVDKLVIKVPIRVEMDGESHR